MARKIADARERLVREKQVSERMVENITSGVVSLDRERRVLMHNRVAAELLGRRAWGRAWRRRSPARSGCAPVADFLRTAGARDGPRHGALAAADGGRGAGVVAGLGPAARRRASPRPSWWSRTPPRCCAASGLLAWAEMARMIAHEIKNPLTPIRLSTEHMMEVYRHDPDHFDRVFERCTSNILTQVDELRSIASEFSAYSSIPRIDPKPGDLVASMADLVEGYRAAPPPGVGSSLETESRRSPPASTPSSCGGRCATCSRTPCARERRRRQGAVVTVERADGLGADRRRSTHGPGVRPDLLPRIFDPYFSTHDTGTGLGLPIARRIVEEHGGCDRRPEPARGGAGGGGDAAGGGTGVMIQKILAPTAAASSPPSAWSWPSPWPTPSSPTA